MKRINLTVLFLFVLIINVLGQEFNMTVSINTTQVGGTDQRVYESLKENITDFFNNRVWTNAPLKPEERLVGAIAIVVKERNSNTIKAELNIALRRPVYGTSYNSPIFNYIDKDFTFDYVESQPMDFSETSYLTNLTSTLAFYAYYCLGIYFDTFALNGGENFFKMAEQVVNVSQSATEPGWKAFDSNKNRYWLAENMTNPVYKPIRQYMYEYHRLGLDVMSTKLEVGKEAITSSLGLLRQLHSEKPSTFFLNILADTKRDEWKNVYSEGTQQEKTKAVSIFRELDPANSEEYEEILKKKN